MNTGKKVTITKSWIARLMSSLLVLALLAGALPQPAVAAPIAATAVTCAQKYTVVSGDTLTKIAAQFNVTLTELATANSLTQPYTIFVGQSLCIPSSSGSSGTTTTTTTTTSAAGFTIARDGNNLIIKVTNLAKKSIFVIKVKTAKRGDDPFIKVGRVKTSKTGTGATTIRLSKSLRTAEFLIVCLKNSVTDAVVCQNWRK